MPDPDSPQADTASPSEKRATNRRRLLIGGVVVLVLIVAGTLYWLHARNYESTDDAFISANVVDISPRISGTVLTVEITDNQPVKTGQVLVRIDPRDAEVQVAEAQANLEAAQGQLQAAQADLELTRVGGTAGIDEAGAAVRSAEAEATRTAADARRYQTLYAKEEIAKQLLDQASTASRAAAATLDQARSQLRNARAAPTQIAQRQATIVARTAQVDQAKAALDQAKLNLGYATITAPVDGKVTRKNVEVGQQVAPGGPLLAIVENQPWVIANFKETQLEKMRVGQPVRFSIDALGGLKLSGQVNSFQSGTGSVFSLLPAENATGNYVKVVQRVPVKLVFDRLPDSAHPLVPGMSVVPTVDISADPQAPDPQAAGAH